MLVWSAHREGRRASDGLVAQGIFHAQSEQPLNSTVAFDSQRLHEACKAKGVLELHLLQKEAAQLKTQYQANVPVDEMNVRQIQHSQFHVSPKAQNNKNHYDGNYMGGGVGMKHADAYFGKAGDLATFIGYCGKNDMNKIEIIRDLNKIAAEQPSPLQKPPLQQQLMQHRLLQQKRQILQKQVAMENGLSRRQMLRQQSYKIAQQQQILPPLPLTEIESEDLLAFQAIVEEPNGADLPNGSWVAIHGLNYQCPPSDDGPLPPSSPHPTSTVSGSGGATDSIGSPKMIKTSHIQLQPIDTWNTLSGSMQTCQISENAMAHENWMPSSPSPHYQVYFSNR